MPGQATSIEPKAACRSHAAASCPRKPQLPQPCRNWIRVSNASVCRGRGSLRSVSYLRALERQIIERGSSPRAYDIVTPYAPAGAWHCANTAYLGNRWMPQRAAWPTQWHRQVWYGGLRRPAGTRDTSAAESDCIGCAATNRAVSMAPGEGGSAVFGAGRADSIATTPAPERADSTHWAKAVRFRTARRSRRSPAALPCWCPSA